MIKGYLKIVVTTLVLFSVPTYATEWVLDSHTSQLNFISIKKGNIAETHQFKSLQGQYDEQGKLTVTIDLASVDTQNPVRDERMKEHLFEVNSYSSAILSATVDTEIVDAIAEGASEQLTVDAVLDLHGDTKPLKIDVIITRLVGAKLSVVSIKPVVINAGDFSLVKGIDKLMALVKLPSISQAVPVTFYLTFNLKRD
ncbi:MAG: YceI family protein [Methylophaga sp.]|nr:YceI family protein [Methylophaga sp.]